MLQPPGEVHCSEVGFSGELVGRMVEGEESRERRRVSSGVLFGCTVLGLGGRVALTSGSFPLAAQAENEGCVVPISLPEPGLVEDGPAAVWLSQPTRGRLFTVGSNVSPFITAPGNLPLFGPHLKSAIYSSVSPAHGTVLGICNMLYNDPATHNADRTEARVCPQCDQHEIAWSGPALDWRLPRIRSGSAAMAHDRRLKAPEHHPLRRERRR